MSRNNKTPIGCYLIMFIIAIPFFIVSTCNDKKSEKEKEKKYVELSKKRENYLRQFDFDIEEMAKDIKNVNFKNIQKSTPRKPIIIFEKRT